MENRYASELLDFASKLDAITDGKGEATKEALSIVENRDEGATVSLLGYISRVNDDGSLAPIPKKIAKSLKDSMLSTPRSAILAQRLAE